MAVACPVVIPTLALLVVMSVACCDVIPVLAVFDATALFAETRASVKYKLDAPSFS